MLGAIAGDIIGSQYEFNAIKTKEFELFLQGSKFTDDTLLSIAVAKSILDSENYLDNIVDFGLRYFEYPVGFGSRFKQWLKNGEHQPYNSWGNGSAMRVSPIGFAFDDENKVLDEAAKSAEVTHNHIEGIKGAQATALAVLMARQGKSKEEMREHISKSFDYDLNRSVEAMRPNYQFEVSCQKSVPESIICFLDSTSFEDAIRNAVSMGGDADTMAAIAGGIAQAYYKEIPKAISQQVYAILPDEFVDIIERFEKLYK
ncbi:MAG: ADP-ribosylglycohydrolase family protein [Campylobacterota bacterium]|nr:ADP-ribosylglycohydrolase family protein [Campylobacterota bacterium]